MWVLCLYVLKWVCAFFARSLPCCVWSTIRSIRCDKLIMSIHIENHVITFNVHVLCMPFCRPKKNLNFFFLLKFESLLRCIRVQPTTKLKLLLHIILVFVCFFTWLNTLNEEIDNRVCVQFTNVSLHWFEFSVNTVTKQDSRFMNWSHERVGKKKS